MVVKYLKSSSKRGILFKKNMPYVEACSYANYAGSIGDQKSTTGFCNFVRQNLISWQRNKHGVVARSSGESKYRAMTQMT